MQARSGAETGHRSDQSHDVARFDCDTGSGEIHHPDGVFGRDYGDPQARGERHFRSAASHHDGANTMSTPSRRATPPRIPAGRADARERRPARVPPRRVLPATRRHRVQHREGFGEPVCAVARPASSSVGGHCRVRRAYVRGRPSNSIRLAFDAGPRDDSGGELPRTTMVSASTRSATWRLSRDRSAR